MHLAIRTPAADLIGDRSAAVADQHIEFRIAVEDVGARDRRDREALFGDEVFVVRFAAAAAAAVDVQRDLHLDRLLVERIPVRIGERRRLIEAFTRIGIEQHADEPEFVDRVVDLVEGGFDRQSGALRNAGDAAKARRVKFHRLGDQLVVRARPQLRVGEAAAVDLLERPRRDELDVRPDLVHQLDVAVGRFLELVVGDRSQGGAVLAARNDEGAPVRVERRGSDQVRVRVDNHVGGLRCPRGPALPGEYIPRHEHFDHRRDGLHRAAYVARVPRRGPRRRRDPVPRAPRTGRGREVRREPFSP